MINLKYVRFYSATGIYEPDCTMDELILKTDKVAVRLLGGEKYETVLNEFLIGPGKSFFDLSEKERNKIEVRRNSYLMSQGGLGVLYIEVSLPLNETDIKSAQNSEGIVWSKLPHKVIAEAAFSSVATAISLSRVSQVSKKYDYVLDGYFCHDEETGFYQRYSHKKNSFSFISANISEGEILTAKKWAKVFQESNEWKSVATLFSNALTPSATGHLHAFIAAWTGLEIFVTKQFKVIQQSIEINLRGELAHSEFSKRMLDVMKDKYRLLDKFSALSSYYCKSNFEADADIEIFKNLKRARDDFFHSMKGEVESLPLEEATKLLEKYLILHLQHQL